MRKSFWVAGVAVAAMLPSVAMAQSSCEQRAHDRRVTGTVLGAVAGAVLGNAIGQHGGKAGGTVIGGVAGAVVGSNVARSTGPDCNHAYGYYDNQNRWHANAVAASDAAGYYDRDGQWVEGAPAGYYSASNEWVSDRSDENARGYRDRDGRWIPASADGYYDSNGQWVGGMSPGYYDNGRWIAGPVRGHYDRQGRWMNGQPNGHMDASGVWVSEAQYGYYDENGRWRAGETQGYYDARGRWIGRSSAVVTPAAYGAPGGERMDGRGDFWAEAGSDTRSREVWLDRRIRSNADHGRMDQRSARHALRVLADIRGDDERSGYGRHRDERRARNDIQERLDALAAEVRTNTRDRRAY